MDLPKIGNFYFHLLYIWYLVNLCLASPAEKNVTSYLDIKKYTLNFLFDIDNDQYNGTVDIDITVKDADKLGKSIVLDTEGLIVTDASIRNVTSTESLQFITTDVNTTLTLTNFLQARYAYTISLNFFGSIQSSGTGITKYNSYNGQYITTNFYPFYARKAFPCFNDVFIKSVFSLTISIVNRNDLKVLSNMPILHKNEQNTIFQFKDTPNIPIYSLFFTIGHYIVSDVASNLYVPTNSITFNNEFDYILQNSEYNSFLKISKLSPATIVAIPGMPTSTFTGYGIVAIREDNLFMNLKKVTTKQRKLSLLDMFGAVYKLFYGNYLTPKSWSDSWLVESIPIYLKYNGLSEVSEWGDPNDYINHDIQQTALKTNSRPDSRPVLDKTLKTEEDVLNFIGGPAMLKGAGILTMLEGVLTKDVLINVLLDYFSDRKNFKGGSVDSDDFVKFLSAHKKVAKYFQTVKIIDIMNTWLTQGGYPYLQTKRAGDGITIDEKVFVSEMPGGNNVRPWKFPIFYSSQDHPVFDDDKQYFWLLLDDNRTVSLNFTSNPLQWIVINVNGTGLYRVNYEDNDWENLAYALNEDYDMFPTSTRAKLVSDAFAMLYSGKADIATVFQFLTYLRNEEEFTPWLTALENFKYLGNLLRQTDLSGDFKLYMETILTDIFTKLGVDGRNVDNAQGILRQEIVSTMCDVGGQACVSATLEDYKKMNDPQSGYSPNPDVRPVILCNGIRDVTDKNDWLALFNTTFDYILLMGKEVRKVYFEALACPQNDDVMDAFLVLIFDTNSHTIAKDDVRDAFRAIFTNPDHTSKALDYLVVNEQVFRDDLTLQDKIKLMRDIAPYLTSDDEMKNLKKYLEVVKPPQEMVDAVTETMKNLNKTQNFLKSNHDNLKKAFQIINPPTPTPGPTSKSTTDSGTTTPTGTTPPGTTTSSSGNSTNTTTTAKPGSASTLNVLSSITLLLFSFGLYMTK